MAKRLDHIANAAFSVGYQTDSSQFVSSQDDEVDHKKQKTENGSNGAAAEEEGEEEEDAEEEEDIDGEEEEDVDGEGEEDLDEDEGGEGEKTFLHPSSFHVCCTTNVVVHASNTPRFCNIFTPTFI